MLSRLEDKRLSCREHSPYRIACLHCTRQVTLQCIPFEALFVFQPKSLLREQRSSASLDVDYRVQPATRKHE